MDIEREDNVKMSEMDLRQYCGLDRPRFTVDPVSDAEFFFGNEQVQRKLLDRIRTDFNVRGVPKCGVVGRFGAGKTHTLYHVKHLFNTDARFPGEGVYVRIGPYDEAIKGMAGWPYLQSLVLDAIGEPTIREWVRAFDKRAESRTESLAQGLSKLFRFGDENLRGSLANVLADYFLRDMKSTLPAWNWLKGGKLDKSDSLQVTKSLDTAPELVSVLLDLANLCHEVTGNGLILLFDEAQHLADVKKRETEIHDAFLQIAESNNENLGFLIGYLPERSGLPKVLSAPIDILSRLGVSEANLNEAFIDLQLLINSQDALRKFMDKILGGIKDEKAARDIVKQHGIADAAWEALPFTSDALDRVAEMLWQKETTRNARQIIEALAHLASEAYERAKADETYCVVDRAFVDSNPYLKSL